MPVIPRVRANIKVGSVPQARQMAPTMNIHQADPMFEQAISSAGQIATAGKQVGQQISNFGARLSAELAEEKAREEKANAMDAFNEYEISNANFMAEQQKRENLTDPNTGAYDPGLYGKDLKNHHETALFEIKQSRNLNDVEYRILQQMANRKYTQQEVSNIKERGKLYVQKTDESWLNRYNNAIQNNNRVEAEYAAKELCKSPNYAGKLDYYLKNSNNAIWQNEYISAMNADINNTDPRKLELGEMPNTIGDETSKQKVKDALVREWDKIMSHKMKAEYEYQYNFLNDAIAKMSKGELSDKQIDEFELMPKMTNGKEYIDAKTRQGLKEMNRAFAVREHKILTDKENKLVNDIKFKVLMLNPKDPKYIDKLADYSKQIYGLGSYRHAVGLQEAISRNKQNLKTFTSLSKPAKRELAEVQRYFENMDNIALYEGEMVLEENEDGVEVLNFKPSLKKVR